MCASSSVPTEASETRQSAEMAGRVVRELGCRQDYGKRYARMYNAGLNLGEKML